MSSNPLTPMSPRASHPDANRLTADALGCVSAKTVPVLHIAYGGRVLTARRTGSAVVDVGRGTPACPPTYHSIQSGYPERHLELAAEPQSPKWHRISTRCSSGSLRRCVSPSPRSRRPGRCRSCSATSIIASTYARRSTVRRDSWTTYWRRSIARARAKACGRARARRVDRSRRWRSQRSSPGHVPGQLVAQDRLQRRDVRGEAKTVAFRRGTVFLERMCLVHACPTLVPGFDERRFAEGRSHFSLARAGRGKQARVREGICLEVQSQLEHAEARSWPDLVVEIVIAGPHLADPGPVQRPVRTERLRRLGLGRGHYDPHQVRWGKTFGIASGSHCPEGC